MSTDTYLLDWATDKLAGITHVCPLTEDQTKALHADIVETFDGAGLDVTFPDYEDRICGQVMGLMRYENWASYADTLMARGST